MEDAEFGTSRRRPARARRRGAARVGRVRGLALRLLLGLAAATALFLLARSQAFAVRGVEVLGTEVLSTAEVRRAAGLDRPLLLWEVWPWGIERRLGRHPRIASADVSFRWPGVVVVRVAERQPVAYVLQQGARYVEVDGDGRVLDVLPAPRAGGQPIITGVEGGAVRPGERLTGLAGRRAVGVSSALGPEGRARISEVHVAGTGEVVLYTLQGLPVFLGVEEDWGPKVRALLGILGSMPDPAKVAYVDLRSARRPVVRVKGAEAAEPPPPPPPPPDEILP